MSEQHPPATNKAESAPSAEKRKSADRRNDDRRLADIRRAGIGEIMEDRRARPRRNLARRLDPPPQA